MRHHCSSQPSQSLLAIEFNLSRLDCYKFFKLFKHGVLGTEKCEVLCKDVLARDGLELPISDVVDVAENGDCDNKGKGDKEHVQTCQVLGGHLILTA